MSGLLDSALFTAVMDAAVRGTIILLAALAGTALMRRSSASARHLVWLAALTALLLLPVARGFVPEWRVLPPAPVFAATSAPPSAAPTAAPVVSADPAPVSASQGMAVPDGRAPMRLPVDWKTLALLAWAAGAALLAARLAYGLARVWWIERRATELTDDGWVRLTDGLARRLRLGRIVRLLREPGATVPMTWGIFRPVILLPGEADGWNDERRRVVLAHELAHVRRWDALTQWVAHLALAVYWFNPLVWVAVRRLREEREHACDDAVLEIGTRPAEYADHLLNIVRSLGSSHGTTTAALAMARRSQFEGRLLAILDNAVRRNGVSRAAGLATAAAALACLVPLAAMRPADRASASPAAAGSTVSTSTTTTTSTIQQAEPVQRPVESVDARERGDVPLRDAVAALAARRDTLASERVALAARTSLVDARAAVARAAADPRGGTGAALLHVLEEEGDPGLYAEIIRASLEIKSPGERRLVLTRLLEQGDLSRDNVIDIVAATRTLDSDGERRLVLTRAMEHRMFPAGGSVMAPLVESVRGMRSASDQRLVLVALMERRRLDTPSLVSLLRAVPALSSDIDRRLVLVAAAEGQRVEGAGREAYLAATRSIQSDTDRAASLAALVDRTAAGPGVRPAAAVVPRPATPPGVERSAREPRRTERVWNSSNEYISTHDGRERVVRVRSRDVIVGAELWDVRGLRAGGTLMVEERVDGVTRRVEATRDGAGNPVWSYVVNGERREFDSAARDWMRDVIRRPAG